MATSSQSVPRLPDIDVLTPNNYVRWKKSMHFLALGDGTLEVITGPMPDDASAAARKEWLKKDERAKAMIYFNVSNQFRCFVPETGTAHDAFKAIENHFSSISHAQVIKLRRELAKFQMKNHKEPLRDMIARARDLKERMDSAGASVTEFDICMAIIGAVHEEYRPYCSAFITGPEEEVTLAKLESCLIRAEMIAGPVVYDTFGVFVTHKGKGFKGFKGKDNSNRRCYKCNEWGHISTECTNQPKPQDEKKPTDDKTPTPSKVLTSTKALVATSSPIVASSTSTTEKPKRDTSSYFKYVDPY